MNLDILSLFDASAEEIRLREAAPTPRGLRIEAKTRPTSPNHFNQIYALLKLNIMLTCPCNVDHLTSDFYSKNGVYIKAGTQYSVILGPRLK